MESHFRAGDHQRVAHIVSCVTHVSEAQSLQRPELFLDGQQIRQHLRGVELVGQSVPDRYPGIFRQLLHQLLTEPPVLDAVIHPSQHPGGVGDGLFLAHLRGPGVQIGDPHPQIVSSDLKGAAGPGGSLLKQKHDVLPLQIPVGDSGPLHGLEILCQIQQIPDLRRRVVQQLQKIPSF